MFYLFAIREQLLQYKHIFWKYKNYHIKQHAFIRLSAWGENIYELC